MNNNEEIKDMEIAAEENTGYITEYTSPESVGETPDLTALNYAGTTGEIAAAPEKKKKKHFIQLPVIISLCLVLLALIGYFTYTLFLLREPEGVLWSTDYDGVTYYYEFREDGIFKTYVGSVELTGTFEKAVESSEHYMTVSVDSGDFYGGQQAKYEITGSRVLNNQEMHVTYEDGKDFTLTQAKEKIGPLELPSDFTPDEALVDTWKFSYLGYEYCTVIFNEDGSMSISYPQNGVTYNGTYTIEDGNVNFTYYINENIVQPLAYSIDNDTLTFMDMPFVRASSLATANEAAN